MSSPIDGGSSSLRDSAVQDAKAPRRRRRVLHQCTYRRLLCTLRSASNNMEGRGTGHLHFSLGVRS